MSNILFIQSGNCLFNVEKQASLDYLMILAVFDLDVSVLFLNTKLPEQEQLELLIEQGISKYYANATDDIKHSALIQPLSKHQLADFIHSFKKIVHAMPCST